MKEKPCPIFTAVKIKAKDVYEECKLCPFNGKCPQDTLDDAVAKVLEQIGEYLHDARR